MVCHSLVVWDCLKNWLRLSAFYCLFCSWEWPVCNLWSWRMWCCVGPYVSWAADDTEGLACSVSRARLSAGKQAGGRVNRGRAQGSVGGVWTGEERTTHSSASVLFISCFCCCAIFIAAYCWLAIIWFHCKLWYQCRLLISSLLT